MENAHSTPHPHDNGSDFSRFMQMGDDFMKIELLRPAIKWYNKALALGIETEKVNQRLDECQRQLAFENRVIAILCAIAALLSGLWIVFGQ